MSFGPLLAAIPFGHRSSGNPPPPIIPKKSERGWQSESNGIAVGTSGFVKYRVAIPPLVIPGGPPPPPHLANEIYIYWVNPFLAGVPGSPPTKAKCAIDIQQVNLDCDPNSHPSSNTGDPTDPPPQLEVVPETLFDNNHPDWGVGRPVDGDEEAGLGLLSIYVAGVATGGLAALPAGIEAMINAGAVEPHAWARFTLRERGSVRQAFSLKYNPANGIRAIVGRGRVNLRKVLRMR